MHRKTATVRPPLHYPNRLAAQQPAPLKQPQHPLPHCCLHPLHTCFIHLRPAKRQPLPPLRHHPVQHAQMQMHVCVQRRAKKDSGGAGRWRGGCGVVRSYRALVDCKVSLWFERSKTPAWGLEGGRSGLAPEILIEGPAETMNSIKLKAHTILAGTVVRTVTGGGGGYGVSLERALEAVLSDVRDCYVSSEGARRDYGVVIDPEALAVDQVATVELRKLKALH